MGLDMKDKIAEETKEVKVPRSIQPEKMAEQLQGIKKKKSKKVQVLLGMAASFLVLVVGVAGYQIASNYAYMNQVIGGGEVADAVTISDEKSLQLAESQEQIYDYLANSSKTAGNGGNARTFETMDSAVAESSSAGVESYSDTNLRQEGVGEGDFVKTDGDYLYVLKENGSEITIVELGEEGMREVAIVNLGEESQSLIAREFYVMENQLIVPCEKNVYDGTQAETSLVVFDITNRNQPKEVKRMTQRGNYNSSRVVDEHFYLFTSYYPDMSNGNIAREYMPIVGGEELAIDEIYMPMLPSGTNFTVISSVLLEENNVNLVESIGVMGANDSMYVSNENIYFYGTSYADDSDYVQTYIRKIGYKDGELKAKNQTKILGSINDSFSIDEYEDHLRIVTTVSKHYNATPYTPPVWKRLLYLLTGDDSLLWNYDVTMEVENEPDTNSVYILDDKLNEVGSIEGIAEEERVYSARFMGDTAYFVTFKDTDPLFTVDLSNPKKPEIIGALKIPGFTEYLHPYLDNVLVGLRMDISEDGMVTNGVKLSAFDITDKTNVQEVHKEVLDGAYGSDVFYNYKAITVSEEKNRIGFSTYGTQNMYYVYSYTEEGGFEKLFERKLSNSNSAPRGVYVGDRIYIVTGTVVEAFDLTTNEKLDDLVL